MASIDVHCLWGSRGGTSGGRWYWASGLVDQTGNVDAVVGEGVIGIGSVIPLHMGELSEVCQIVEGVAAVSEEFGDVCMLWFVFCCQLRSMKVGPPFDLFLVGKLVEMWWMWLPRRMGASSYCWNVGKFRLGHVCDLVVRCMETVDWAGE